MRRPSSLDFALALRLLRLESDGSMEPQALASAVDGVCTKLSSDLERVVGPGGAAALVRRARTLASREFPDVPARSADADAEQAEAANAAVLAHLIAMLVDLLGEELGLRPIRKIWPGAVSGDDTLLPTESRG